MLTREKRTSARVDHISKMVAYGQENTECCWTSIFTHRQLFKVFIRMVNTKRVALLQPCNTFELTCGACIRHGGVLGLEDTNGKRPTSGDFGKSRETRVRLMLRTHGEGPSPDSCKHSL